jgi:hypothetical protein
MLYHGFGHAIFDGMLSGIARAATANDDSHNRTLTIQA